jgi:hypothetical protein
MAEQTHASIRAYLTNDAQRRKIALTGARAAMGRVWAGSMRLLPDLPTSSSVTATGHVHAPRIAGVGGVARVLSIWSKKVTSSEQQRFTHGQHVGSPSLVDQPTIPDPLGGLVAHSDALQAGRQFFTNRDRHLEPLNRQRRKPCNLQTARSASGVSERQKATPTRLEGNWTPCSQTWSRRRAAIVIRPLRRASPHDNSER